MNHKLLKICQKNGLKIDEFRTHQIPLNLRFCLSPSKEKKNFCLSSNNLALFLRTFFCLIHNLVGSIVSCKIISKHVSNLEFGRFSIKFTKKSNNLYSVNNSIIQP